jgi:hypothetical protein
VLNFAGDKYFEQYCNFKISQFFFIETAIIFAGAAPIGREFRKIAQ